MLSCTLIRRAVSCGVLLIPIALCAQTGPTATPEQAPKTAPQVEQVLPSYEGQNVTSLELAGQPDLNTQMLLPLISQRAGEPFARAKVDASVAAIQSTGQFHTVELEIRPDANGVRLLFVLQPAIYFGIYEFPGATERFPYSRLLQVADYPPRGAYTPVDIEHAQAALETFFRRNGYFQVEVRPEIQTDKLHGLVNVFFHTRLSRRAKFGKVEIKGATSEETAHLEGVLHSWKARLRGSAIRQGKTYSLKTLQNATRYLENELMKQDHLAGEVKLIGANYDPETNRADVQFNVTTGPLVHVKVQGSHLWSRTRHRLLPLYQQVGLDPELIQEGRQNLISYFQSKGYFNTRVDSQVQQQPGGETVLYQITKGPRHKVSAVNIAGNQHISDKDLSSVLKVGKARFFSHGQYSEKLVRASVINLKRVYEANGFSSVQITPQVQNRNGNIAVTFQVNEGPQDIVEALRLQGNTVPESQLAPQGLKLTAGQPYSTKRADEDRNQIMAQYLRLGFLNATFRQIARQAGNNKHRLEVAYIINEGPRVETASVVTVGRKDTRQTLIDRTAQVKAGEPMREDELLMSESRLYNLGVFDWTEIDPRRQITTQTQEDVLVKVHEAKKNSLTYGFGFEVINRGGSIPSGTVALPNLPAVGLPVNFKTSQETFWGPRVSLEYTRKNVRGKAETITFAGLAARLLQRASVTFQDPHFRSTEWASNLTLSGEHNSENPIFTSRLAEFGFQLQRPLNADKTRNLFLRYSLRQTGLTHLLIPELVPPEDRHVRLSTLSANYIRDTRDNVLDAQKGIYESFQLDFNPHVLGSSVDFAKFLGQTAYYKKMVGGVIWANSVRLGLEQPFAGSHVPVSEEFFSGGGSTLRGFPLNGAGPQREILACGNPADQSTCAKITVPVGGRQLFILNSEFRIPIQADLPLVHKNLGLAAFYDGGNVYERIGFHNFWADYTNTVGLGFRYKTPVGPIRIDVGHNLSPQPGIKSTQFFITLGQAF
jgi:outer membrane protein insertion porin family